MKQVDNAKRSIYLPIDLWKSIDELAVGTTRSNWIRVAILRRIKEIKKDANEEN